LRVSEIENSIHGGVAEFVPHAALFFGNEKPRRGRSTGLLI
jgi:hypothetical protein